MPRTAGYFFLQDAVDLLPGYTNRLPDQENEKL